MARLPRRLEWLFWEADFRALDDRRDADYILARILEHGTMDAVHWVMRHYGLRRIHRFFQTAGHPEITERTRAFWRVVLHAEHERWPSPNAWRQVNIVPWSD